MWLAPAPADLRQSSPVHLDTKPEAAHLAGGAGSTKDLMARMGHDDMRAALIYQRATSEADQKIADQLSRMVDELRYGSAKGEDRPTMTRAARLDRCRLASCWDVAGDER